MAADASDNSAQAPDRGGPDPTISVALATYNGERFLPRQLNSLLGQTSPPAELIVSDDGSTDRTLAIVRRFQRAAPFQVQILQNEHRLGYRRNFVQAAAACRHDLIAFCDQDDIWHPNKLRRMQGAFADPMVLFAYHNATLIDRNDTSIGALLHRHGSTRTLPPLALRPFMLIPGNVQMFRRSLLRLTPLHTDSIDPYMPNDRMSHDIWYPFWASVLGRVAYVDQKLVQYRQHGFNTSGWKSGALHFIKDNIANAELYVQVNAMAASNRIDLLRRSRALMPTEQAAIEAAIRYYKHLLDWCERRVALYRGRTTIDRARHLFRLLRSGAYTSATSRSFRLDALLLDVAVGVACPRLGRT